MPTKRSQQTKCVEREEEEPRTPAKKARTYVLESSPLQPLPSVHCPQMIQPSTSFNNMKLESFDRQISTDLPRDPLAIFSLFCPPSLVVEWAVFMNGRRTDQWQATYTEELYIFFGILIYMSYNPLSSIDEYWATSTTSAIHPITRFMVRDRFLGLYRRFCTWDTLDKTKSTVFEKIKGWSDHLHHTSTEYWRPSSEVSVDEAMVRFTGRSKDIVHLPSKPIPVGYKVWVIADSGYFLKWRYHSKGNGPVDYLNQQGFAPTQGVVLDLLNRLPLPPSPNHGYHCYMDNLFATPQLFHELRQRGIAATGTTRLNRIDSKQMASLRAEDSRKDFVPLGTVYARKHKETEVMQFGFKDNAFVLLLSTHFTGWEAPVERLRRQPTKSSTSAKTARVPFEGKSTRNLMIPSIIDSYNHNMNGVDIGDQLRAGFQSNRRIKRGGQQALLFLFLFELSVTNSFLLFRHNGQNPKACHGGFRKLLFEQILVRFGQQVASQKHSTKEGVACLYTPDHAHHTLSRLQTRQFCAYCSSKKRNILIFEPQLTKAPPQKALINTGCQQCGVALCHNKKRDCWAKWHRQDTTR